MLMALLMAHRNISPESIDRCFRMQYREIS
ncbi:hypothetical protein BBM1454_02480 [Bifidobacterium breve MCC 1454]|nr:hypothetical protein BBM1340_01430 [Bifidobacterium breve MCC 1340]KOA57068.1 hypothetical protein BBM1454_02480 [Bifidobacterium breve MCC 1454]